MVVDHYQVTIINDKHCLTVKVIDDTLNRHCGYQKHNKIINCCFLTFVSNTAENLPKVKNVGDIIWVRRFYFGFGESERDDLRGNEMPEWSNWMLFSASQGWSLINQKQLKINENIRDLFPTERERFDELKQWALDLFTKHSIWNLNQWTYLIEPNLKVPKKSLKKKQNNIDLLLRTVSQ